MSKPMAILAETLPEPVIRCYNLEEGYAWMVQQDVIARAIEDAS